MPLAKVAMLNTRSVCNKSIMLHEYVRENTLAMMFITETWLRSGDKSIVADLCPEGYSFINKPRQTGPVSRGGGVDIVHKSSLSIHQNMCFSDNFTSFKALSVDLLGSQPLSLFLVYRPPPSKKNGLSQAIFMQEIEQFLASVSAIPHSICVLADFNIHMEDSDSRSAQQFTELLQSLGLTQAVTSSTYKSKHTLDLVITRDDEDIVNFI